MNAATGQDNRLDKAILRPYNASMRGAVTTFRDSGCKGETGRFDTLDDASQPARYNQADMWTHNQRRLSISSVMVPKGYSIKLHADDGFGGKSTVIHGDRWNSVNNEEMVCQAVGDGMDSKTKSLEVYRTSFGQLAKGDWVHVEATESIKFTYYMGFVNKSSYEETDDEKYSLNLQMSEGISFEGVSESETITEEYSSEITTDTMSSEERDINTGIEIPCTGSVGPEGGVGLWQWVVRKNESDSWVQTGITHCRYGALANVKPECPWPACIGGDCSSCKDDWIAQ